jgi:hypothetical protein
MQNVASDLTTDTPPLTIPVRDLIPRAVSWLWPGRLAIGKLALLEGDPGLGKSLAVLDLCARLTTGRPFPNDCPTPGPANALVLNAEDGREDTIRPRLEALGADLSRVFVFRQDETTSLLRLPSETAFLKKALIETAARLVVIDPIVAFLEPGVQITSDQSVRHALCALSDLAEARQSVVVLIRHLNKSGDIHSLYRGGGSIGFQAACRSSWLVALDPGDPKRRILAQVKNNLAPYQPSLVFQVENSPAAPPTLTWLGESTLLAGQLLAGAVQRPPVCVRDFARDFLLEFLKDGPRTLHEIWDAAQKHGVGSRRTMHRARDKLNIRTVEVYLNKKRVSYWLLPGQDLPDSIPPESRPDNVEPWLAPLREQYPTPNPLHDL